MKKTFALILLVLSFILLVWLGGSAEQTPMFATALYAQGSLSDCAAEQADLEAVSSTRTHDEHLAVTILFDDEPLFYDTATKTYLYSLPKIGNTTATPTVSIRSSYGPTKLIVKNPLITPASIEANTSFPATIITPTAYCNVTIRCTTLPIIHLVDMDDFELYDNAQPAGQRWFRSEAKFRARGATSLSYPKKSFSIKLKKQSPGGNRRPNMHSLLGMRQSDAWLLTAMYNDPDKIRNAFSMNLWFATCATDNTLGVLAGMEYRYVELFVQSQYWGLYTLGFPVDSQQVMLSPNPADNILLKKGFWIDDRDLYYTLRYRKGDYKYVGPGSKSMPDHSLLERYLEHLNANKTNSAALLDWVDTNNMLNYALFMTLIQGVDNIQPDTGKEKNVFMALYADHTRVRSLLIPWDLDLTWGNAFDEQANNGTAIGYYGPAYTHQYFPPGYYTQILNNNDSDTGRRLIAKYQELRAGSWSDNALEDMLAPMEAAIFDSGAYKRDMERWPEGNYADPAAKLSNFRQFVLDRAHACDSYIANMEQRMNKGLPIISTTPFTLRVSSQ